jgi:hypothetical protein
MGLRCDRRDVGPAKRITNKTMKEQIWDTIIEHGLASDETLTLITKLNGWSLDTMESVLYALTGYHDLDQYRSEDE